MLFGGNKEQSTQQLNLYRGVSQASARIFSTIRRGKKHVAGNSIIPLHQEPRVLWKLQEELRLGLDDNQDVIDSGQLDPIFQEGLELAKAQGGSESDSEKLTNSLNSKNKDRILELLPGLGFPNSTTKLTNLLQGSSESSTDGIADLAALKTSMGDPLYSRHFFALPGKSLSRIIEGFRKREEKEPGPGPFFIHVLSLDIEGHELPVLRDVLRLQAQGKVFIALIMVEMVHHRGSGSSYAEMVGLLRKQGFEKTKIAREAYVSSVFDEDEIWVHQSVEECRAGSKQD